MISKSHSNRQAHNWLIYDIGDNFLKRYTHLYKGALYDLGCGESPFRDFFLQYADDYKGVDWAGSFHDTKADIAADLNKPLPICSGVADTIVSLSVMEHLCEPQLMLDEAYRILKPGGSMILQVPWQWWIHEAPYDFFRYTPYGLKYLLEKSGFTEVHCEAQSGFFTMLVLKINYFSRVFIRGPNLIRYSIRMVLKCLWYVGQKLAPILDRIDKNWDAETTGYFIVAIKNNSS